jgi:PTS system mannose-specific IIA component
MVGILIVSHGALSTQLIEAAKMIVGEHENLEALQLEQHQGLEDFKQGIRRIYDRENTDNQGLLILTDIFGGTPSNAAFMLLDELNLSIVSGVNLPMLLEILLQRNGRSLEGLTEIAMQSGKEAIKDISNIYKNMIS